MANKIIVEFEVTDKGTLKQITQGTEKLTKSVENSSKATEQAGSSKNRYNKMEKGTAQLTSNTTKSFAKQAQTIGSGLVPAYATLAANIFAVSAAFGALKRAAGLEQLEAGLIAVGSAAGQNLPYIADQLREITGAAISTQSAMESVALGTSAGFSTKQMEELTRVAKGASLALGRDMEDAMSRLVRGAAKLEPEILDELGIMIRLDDVTSRYAENIGKTVDSLTQFERRMAFTNAIIDQGIDKFGQIAEKIDPNPYNQLAARFADITKNVLQLINTGLGPFLDLLANNTAALVGTLAVFGTSIASKMLPALFEAAEAAADAAENLDKVAEAQLKNIDLSGHLPKSMAGLNDKIKEGTLGYEEQGKVVKNLGQSQKILSNHLKTAIKDHGRESEIVAEKTKKLQNVTRVRKDMVLAMVAASKSEAKAAQAVALEEIAQGRLRNALKLTRVSYAANRAAMQTNMQVQSRLVKSLSAVKIGLFGVTSALKLASVAFLKFLTFLPYIGLAITIFSALKAAWDKLFGKSEAEKQVDEIVKSFDSFSEVNETLEGTITNIELMGSSMTESKRNAELYTASLKAQAGVYGQIADAIEKVLDLEKQKDMEAVKSLRKKLRDLERDLTSEEIAKLQAGGEAAQKVISTGYKMFGRNKAMEYYFTLQKVEKKMYDLGEASEKAAKSISDNLLENAIINIESNKAISKAMQEELRLYKQYQDVLREFANDPEIIQEVKKAIDDMAGAKKQAVAELEGLSETSRNFNIEFTKLLKADDRPFEGVLDSLALISSALNNASSDSDRLGAAWEELPAYIIEVLGKEPDLQGLENYISKWEEASAAIANAERNAKKFKDEAKGLEGLLNIDPSLVDDYYIALDRGVQAQITALEKRKELFEGQVGAKERILEIDREIAGLETKLSSVHAQNITFIESYISQYQTLEKLSSKVTENTQARLAAELSLKEAQLRMTAGEDGEVTAREELEIFEALKSSRIEAALREAEIKKKSIDSEYLLAELQFELLRQEFALADKKMPEAFESNYRELLEQGKSSAIAAVEAETRLALQMIESTHQDKFNSLKDEAEKLAKTFSNIKFDFNSANSLSGVLGDLGDYADVAKGVAGLLDTYQQLPEVHNKEVEAIKEVMEWRQEALENAGQNAIEQSRIYSQAAEKQKQIEEDAARAKLATYSQYVAGVGGILSSLAETQDTTTKEGFEKQKNMQMAAAVVNTAGAVMNALATVPYPASIAMAAAVAATGAMQIAKIKSTKFGDSDSGGLASVSASAGGGSGSPGGAGNFKGTVLGSDKASESINNTLELLDDIHAKEYRELRGIHTSMESLNRNITGLVSDIVLSVDGKGLGFATGLGTDFGTIQKGAYATAEFIYDLNSSITKFGSFGNDILGGILGLPGNILGKGAEWMGDIVGSVFGGSVKTSLVEAGYEIGEITVQQLQDGVSASVQQYNRVKIKKKGGWFKSDKTSYKDVYEEVNDQISGKFTQIFSAIGDSLVNLAGSLGDTEDINRALAYEFDPGKIDLKDLDPAEIDKRLREMISFEADLASAAILEPIVSMYAQVEEGLFETAARMMATKVIVSDALAQSGIDIADQIRDSVVGIEVDVEDKIGAITLEIVDSIAKVSGGLKEFQKSFEVFYDNFFTDDEKFERTSKNLTGIFSDLASEYENLNIQLPKTREGYKDLVSGLDITTASGQEAYATLLSLSEQSDEYYSYLEDKEKEFSNTVKEFYSLEAELLNAQGRSYEAIALQRAQELNELDEYWHATKKQIWALEDFNNLQNQHAEILGMLGREEEALAYEREQTLKSLSGVGKILQSNIYDMTDYIERTEELASAEDRLAEARDNAMKSVSDLIDNLIGSDKAPVQSMEYFENKYSRLQGDLATAKTPKELEDASSALIGFSENYLDFMAAYGGNYKDAFNATMGTLAQAQNTIDNFSTTVDDNTYFAIQDAFQAILGTTPSMDRIFEFMGVSGDVGSAIRDSLTGGDIRRAGTHSDLTSEFGHISISDYPEQFARLFGSNIDATISQLIDPMSSMLLNVFRDGLNLLAPEPEMFDYWLTKLNNKFDSLPTAADISNWLSTSEFNNLSSVQKQDIVDAVRAVNEDDWRYSVPSPANPLHTKTSIDEVSIQRMADSVKEAINEMPQPDNNIQVNVTLGGSELRDKHVEWHRTDPEAQSAVRRGL